MVALYAFWLFEVLFSHFTGASGHGHVCLSYLSIFCCFFLQLQFALSLKSHNSEIDIEKAPLVREKHSHNHNERSTSVVRYHTFGTDNDSALVGDTIEIITENAQSADNNNETKTIKKSFTDFKGVKTMGMNSSFLFKFANKV